MVMTRLKTTQDLLKMPDDGWRHELLEGEIIRMPPPGSPHGSIEIRLGARLFTFIELHGSGMAFSGGAGFPIEADPETTLGPDIAFVRAERLPPRDQWTPYAPVVPDLVVEIVSPSERPGQVARKLAVYLRAGVQIVWLVRPLLRVVEVHRPGQDATVLGVGDALDGYEVLPGFTLPVADIFA